MSLVLFSKGKNLADCCKVEDYKITNVDYSDATPKLMKSKDSEAKTAAVYVS